MDKKTDKLNDIENIYYNKFKKLYLDSLFNISLAKIVSENIYSGNGFHKIVLSGAMKAHKEMEDLFKNNIPNEKDLN